MARGLAPNREIHERWHQNSGCQDPLEEKRDRFLNTAKRLISTSTILTLFDTVMEREIEKDGFPRIGRFNAVEYCNKKEIVLCENVPLRYHSMIDYAYNTFLSGTLSYGLFSEEE